MKLDVELDLISLVNGYYKWFYEFWINELKLEIDIWLWVIGHMDLDMDNENWIWKLIMKTGFVD